MRNLVLLVVVLLSLNTAIVGQENNAAKAPFQTAHNQPVRDPNELSTVKSGREDSETLKQLALTEIDSGKRLFESKDYKVALEAFESAFKKDPTLFAAAYWLGLTNIQLKNYEASNRALMQAVTLQPGSADSWHYLGYSYDKLNDKKNAIRSYLQALSIDPQKVVANNNLGVDYLELRQYDQAPAAFRRVLDVDSNHQSAIEGMCFASTMLGQFGDAAKYCLAAKSRNASWEISYFLGNAFLSLGRFQEALPQLNDALSLQPGSAAIHLALGDTYRGLKRFGEALEQCRRAVELDPGLAPAYEAMAEILSEKSKYREAKEIFYKALALNPKSETALYNLAITCLALGQRDCALEQYHTLQNLSAPQSNQLFGLIYRHRVINVAQR